MKQTQLIMGMPVTIDLPDRPTGMSGVREIMGRVFDFFRSVDEKFSPFKEKSEVTRINTGEITRKNYSPEMQAILSLAEKTKEQTGGFFNVFFRGKFDPSGIVKGWAISQAAEIITEAGYKSFVVEAGGDLQATGKNWRVGIRNPFNKAQIVKVLKINGQGVATSGNYERGKHIYIPQTGRMADEIASLTVIADDVCEADRFATAAFAMGQKGIAFIENSSELEGYMIDRDGRATFTSGFNHYVAS